MIPWFLAGSKVSCSWCLAARGAEQEQVEDGRGCTLVGGWRGEQDVLWEDVQVSPLSSSLPLFSGKLQEAEPETLSKLQCGLLLWNYLYTSYLTSKPQCLHLWKEVITAFSSPGLCRGLNETSM